MPPNWCLQSANGQIVPLLKYYYFKQLLTTFDVGAILRSTPISSTESDMAYTYGQSLRSTLLLPSILMEAGHQRGQRHRSMLQQRISQWYAAITYQRNHQR